MKVLRKLDALRDFIHSIPPEKSLGLVPTMGALHEGHLSLVRQSTQQNELTMVSIFVNPTQFGPNEDFDQYPRRVAEDAQMLSQLGVDVIFTPDVRDVYPGAHTYISFHLAELGDKLCARSRPGHMEGVLQVVSILFHLTAPTRAYFGLKDYQQCLIIQKLVLELHFPLEVVPCPIIREKDGLAMSSRNMYLSAEEREQALFLSTTLSQLKKNFSSFSTVEDMCTFVAQNLEKFPLVQLDYFEVLDGDSLAEVQSIPYRGKTHAFIAAYLGKTRLIDNMRLSEAI
ncbi:MAG: pantoate--beta-alanine ligase [Bacteroidota bacterium]